MRRLLLLVVLTALLFGGFFIGQARAVTYSGGEEWQREAAREVIESLPEWRYIEKRVDEIREQTGGLRVEFVYMENAGGGAAPGVIYLSESLPTPLNVTHTMAHEFGHYIWYAMYGEWQQKWLAICPGDNLTWQTAPTEHFAECMRVGVFDIRFSLLPYVFTSLVVPTPAEAAAFYRSWVGSTQHRTAVYRLPEARGGDHRDRFKCWVRKVANAKGRK